MSKHYRIYTPIELGGIIVRMKGFRDFILRGNVVDLAVAVVIGAAFNNVVNALVKDLITPLIGAIGGQPDFSNFMVTINGADFAIGTFINAVISFLIIAAVVYFLVVMPMSKLMATLKKSEPTAAPTEKICPECLSAVPLAAKRCKFCTSPLKK